MGADVQNDDSKRLLIVDLAPFSFATANASFDSSFDRNLLAVAPFVAGR